MPSRPDRFAEIGRSGLNRWGGHISEEFLKELVGKRGIKVYKEMGSNDSIIASILFAIEMLLRQAERQVVPGGEAPEDVANAEFLESCLDDMSFSWEDSLAEILSFLQFGWSYHEVVFKRRLGPSRDPTKNSQHTDGRIGWRKLAIRAQETLNEWVFDDNGGLQGMKQSAPPSFEPVVIPIDKALLFRTRVAKGNPEGRSILRTAYRAWHFKRRLEEIEGIGIERDLAGLPVLTPPEDLDLWNTSDPDMANLRQEGEDLVQNIRRDEMEGVLKPFGWTLELLAAAGARQTDAGAVIERWSRHIAMTVLADFIMLGHEKVGSFALASSKTNLFAVALGAFLRIIESVFNRFAIPQLFALNGIRAEKLPALTFVDIEAPPLDELGAFLKDMTGVGVITPGPELEAHVRARAGLPEEAEPASAEEMRRTVREATEDKPPEEEPEEETDA